MLHSFCWIPPAWFPNFEDQGRGDRPKQRHRRMIHLSCRMLADHRHTPCLFQSAHAAAFCERANGTKLPPAPFSESECGLAATVLEEGRADSESECGKSRFRVSTITLARPRSRPWLGLEKLHESVLAMLCDAPAVFCEFPVMFWAVPAMFWGVRGVFWDVPAMSCDVPAVFRRCSGGVLGCSGDVVGCSDDVLGCSDDVLAMFRRCSGMF